MIHDNEMIRVRFIKVVEDNGIRYNWISNKINIANSTLSSWKLGNFDLGQDKLNTVNEFLKRYE